ncbi:hypothetical protein E2F48_16105 [Arthrobacter crusticola]|uniref:Uncharacterized protein n=1 Tax=Arthrobacter crusticola TaxID=2547960 RepID=A0A4R5TRF8_9MICC|nr:hypothetical protein [Arthrobacter crusticola]TDK23513.1 hypothetical protein E2F48_16105 [Arthrobacter crusticola]
MALNWDVEKFPRRQGDWERFVVALADQQQSEPPFEDFWLEQKSQIEPLRSPGIGKIAKCLIGMANRLPEVADRAMGGHGLMVCGLEDGHRIGVARTEDHQLENALRLFLGDEGPVWSARRLPADQNDREVLILIVDAPVAGDPIHVSYRASEGIQDGGVYVRNRTETRSARGNEHRALVQRLQAGGGPPDLDLTVELVSPLYGARWERTFLERYTTTTKESLLSPARPATSSGSGSGSGGSSPFGILGNPFQKPETRTRVRFEHEVEEWAAIGLELADEIAEQYLARALPGAVFRVVNNSDIYLKNVQLAVHLEQVKHIEHQDTDELDLSDILPQPRPYGPYDDPFTGIPSHPSLASMIPGTWQSAFRSDGSADAVFEEPALRPRGSFDTDREDSVLYVPGGKEGDQVKGTWTLTAEGLDRRYEGSLTISVATGLVLGDGLIRNERVVVRQDVRNP